MDAGLRSTSPRGEYIVTVSSWEVRMSLWIDTPTLTNRTTGENLLSFNDPNWSLNEARWIDDSTVVLRLRKYPGNHSPGAIDVTINCAARTAVVGLVAVRKLDEVERQLEKALDWK